MHRPMSTIEATATPRVAVIVATRGRPEALRRAIGSILANTYPHFRLFIIDQTPGDEPPFAPGELPEEKVVYLRTPWSGKSRALNYALTLCDEPIIAFTDDDCTVPPDWLACGVAALAAEPAAALLFGTFAAAPHDPEDEFVPAFAPLSRRVVTGGRALWDGMLGVGANLFARRGALDRIGGFDEELGPGGRYRTGEDVELTFRALRRGFAVVQDPAIAVMHHGGRPFAGGAARQSITDAYFALGAGYGKHIRAGDPMAAVLLLRWVQLAVFAVASNVWWGRFRRTGVRSGLALVRGAASAFWHGRMLYRPSLAAPDCDCPAPR